MCQAEVPVLLQTHPFSEALHSESQNSRAAEIRDVFLLNYMAADRNKDLSMSQLDY